MSMTLKIVSPERLVYNGAAVRVVVPGTNGEFEILTGHAPIISSLQNGKVAYQTAEGQEMVSLTVTGGFVAVQKNNVSLCVETV